MGEFGEFLGIMILISYAGALLNFVTKRVNKRYAAKIKANASLSKFSKTCTRIFVRNHRYWGMAAVGFILLHFIVQYTHLWLSQSGLIAAGVMVVQVILGGILSKKYNKTLVICHRIIALAALGAILNHVL